MNTLSRRCALLAALVLFSTFMAVGCNNDDKELNRQIQQQISLIEDQVKKMEQSQENMRNLIREMQAQLDVMEDELNKEAPRIHSAQNAVSYLRQLTTVGFGESAAESTLRDPGWSMTSVLWLLLFVTILWLLYRFRQRSSKT
jgi:uncharacterized protein HemX